MAEEAVFDAVGVAHVCGAADGVGEMLGAVNAGESVGVSLIFAVRCNGAVCGYTSRRKLRRQSESGARHGCEGIFSVDILIRYLLQRMWRSGFGRERTEHREYVLKSKGDGQQKRRVLRMSSLSSR